MKMDCTKQIIKVGKTSITGNEYLSNWNSTLDNLYKNGQIGFNDYTKGKRCVREKYYFTEDDAYSLTSKASKLIVHVVFNDKFTSFYVNFFKKYFNNYAHVFILTVNTENYKLDLINQDEVYFLGDNLQLAHDENVKSFFGKASKIILTGGWMAQYLDGYNDEILSKLYIHMWGGDFYQLGDYAEHSLELRNWELKRLNCMRRCKALIFLIKGENEKFEEITNLHKPYFIGSFPAFSKRNCDYDVNFETENENRVLIGNSATVDNNHIEIFNMLSKWSDRIKIVVPLSYGEAEYREEVKKAGREIFKQNFIPIEHYMDRQDYINLLSTCKAGIFDNNRQRALGNIDILLHLGKKVYLRNGTSMWDMFREKGIHVHDVMEIATESVEDFLSRNEITVSKNKELRQKLWAHDAAIAEWAKILEYEG